MKKIAIVADQGADLSEKIINEHQIEVVKVQLDWPELENLPGENTFQRMRELEKKRIESFGKTSQPSPKAFLEAYKKQFEKGFEAIICLAITSKLSGTYNSALQAKNFLNPQQQQNVFVVDTLNASSGEALVVLRAIELIGQGKEPKEIVEILEKLVPKTHFFLMFKDPKWLEKSGRISSLVASLMRSLAKAGIRPLLAFKEGVLAPAGVKTRAKDIPTGMFKEFQSEFKKSGAKTFKVVITHGDDPEGANRLKEMIESNFEGTEVVFTSIINDVVGSLVGPDALTCGWYAL
jgi:DegV family protein with EDD domain